MTCYITRQTYGNAFQFWYCHTHGGCFTTPEMRQKPPDCREAKPHLPGNFLSPNPMCSCEVCP